MLRPFAHPVARWGVSLGVVTRSLKPAKLFVTRKRTQQQHFLTNNVASVCTEVKATLSFLSYQNFSPSHNFEQHWKSVCTNHCMTSKEIKKVTFSNSTNLKQKDTKMLTSVLIKGGKVRCKK